MLKENLTREKWDILDCYIEDMIVAAKNNEISITTCKSYLSNYIYEASYSDLDEMIERIDKLANDARQLGWNKSH